MENRDPYALIEKTAAHLQRRRLVNLALPGLPPAAVLAAFAALGRLPVELAAAGLVVAAALLVHVSAPGPGNRGAASRLDERTGGRDHFLTLATSEIASPMRELVEDGAARLGEGLGAADLAPPLPWRGFARGALTAAALALLLSFAPKTFPPAPVPAERLEAIAGQLEQRGGAAEAALARELRAAASALRDPEASLEEQKQAVQQALEKLEEQEQKQEKGSGTQGGGGEQGETPAAGSDELREEARATLEQASESAAARQSGTGESGGEPQSEQQGEDSAAESEGAPPGESGGGIDAPRPESSGAQQRAGESEGGENRPDGSPSRSADARGGAGEGREPRDPARPGAGEAKGPDPSGGEAKGGNASSPSTSEGPGNPDLPGEGTGWRIVEGRYVRVRVPEGENQALETERVRGPGEVEPTTPYSNAPLPGEGPSGEPIERQPLPLEYRNVLKEGTSR